jgi:hypothetical protein
MASDAEAAFGAPEEKRRGSRAGYGVAALVGVLAVAGAIAWFVAGFGGLSDAVDDLARVPIPGSATVHLDEGKGAIYYEFAGGEPVPALEITIRLVDGPDVPVREHGGETNYDLDGHDGRSIAGYDIREAGDYRVAVRGVPGGTIALGHGVGGKIVSAVVGGLAVLFVGLGLCAVLIILTARRRRT